MAASPVQSISQEGIDWNRCGVQWLKREDKSPIETKCKMTKTVTGCLLSRFGFDRVKGPQNESPKPMRGPMCFGEWGGETKSARKYHIESLEEIVPKLEHSQDTQLLI